MLRSVLRVLSLAATLALSLGLALAIGMALARFGYLGTCHDGTCELVAAIYVMPLLGVALYVSALIIFSILTVRNRNRAQQ